MTDQDRQLPSDSSERWYRKTVKRTTDSRTQSSETIEEFNPQTGHIIKRAVRSESGETRTQEDEVIAPDGGSETISAVPPTRIAPPLPPDWHEKVARQVKVAVFAVDEPVPSELDKFAGDYILSDVFRDPTSVRFEYTFPISDGLFRLSLIARLGLAGQLDVQVRFEGTVAGPAWTGSGDVVMWQPLILRRDRSVPPAAFGDEDWPETVEVTPLGGHSLPAQQESTFRISAAPSAAELATMSMLSSLSSSGGTCPVVDSVQSTDQYTIQDDPTTFLTPPRSESEDPTTLVATLSSGSSADMVWEVDGVVSGSGPSVQIISETCRLITIRILCVFDDSVLWSGSLSVECPEVEEVYVQIDAELRTRPRDPDNDEYFLTPLGGGNAVLCATLLPQQNWSVGITWESYGGSSCDEGTVNSPYDNDRACAEITVGSETDDTKTFCLRIVCCEDPIWEGKLEVYETEVICETCTAPPGVGNPPAQESPSGGGGGSLGTIAPPNISTGAADPLGGVNSAGPAAINPHGQLSFFTSAPPGSPLDFPIGASYRASTRFDSPTGYGWTNSFTRNTFTTLPSTAPDYLDHVRIFGGGGTALTYSKALGSSTYSAPAGSRSKVVSSGGGSFAEHSVVDGRSWQYSALGILSGISHGATAWSVGTSIFHKSHVPTSITGPSGQSISIAYTNANPPRATQIMLAGGRTIQLGYNKRRLASYAQPGQAAYVFSYDEIENLTGIKLPGGGAHVYDYDTQYRVTRWQNALGHVTTYVYDVGANKNVLIDPLGRRTTVTHDGSSLALVTSIEKCGRVWNYGWSGGYPTSFQDPNGNSVSYSYRAAPGGAQQLAGMTDAAGKTYSYGYDTDDKPGTLTGRDAESTLLKWNASGQRTGLVHPSGIRVTYAYDGHGQLKTVVNELGKTYENRFDTKGNRIALARPSGKATTYTYDAFNQLRSQRTPLGFITTYTRDQMNRVTAQTNPLDQTTNYAFNADGLLTSTSNPLSETSTNVYNVGQQLIASIDPLNLRTSYAYDAVGNQVRVTNALGQLTTTVYDDCDNPVAGISPSGRRTTSVYDPGGRRIATIDPLENRTTTLYNGNGWVIATVDPAGNRTSMSYDDSGRQTGVTNPLDETRQSAYNSAGLLRSTTDPLGHRTTYSYDAVGRQVAVTNPLNETTTTLYDDDGLAVSSIDPLGRRTTTVYDEDDRAVSSIDPLGNRTTTVYDKAGRSIASVDPLGNRGSTVYDAAGRTIATVDPLGNRNSTVYDDAGRTVASIDPLGARTSFAYDDLGRRISETNPLNETTLSFYDSDGQLIDSVNPLGEKTRYGYDQAGRQITVTNPLGEVTTTVYNSRGLAVASIDPLGHRTTTTYDAASRAVAVVNPLNEITTTLYDAAGRTVATVDALGNRSSTVYDAAGNQIAAVNPLDERTTTLYDENNRPLVTIDPLGRRTTTTYDETGRAISTVNALSNRTTSVYDNAGRQIAVIDANDNRTTTIYDAVGRTIRTVNPLNNIVTSGYDAAGQKTLRIDARDNRTTYSYDAAGRVERRLYPDGSRITWTYDKNGNPTLVDQPDGRWTRTYDALDRVISVEEAASGALTFSYDAAGRRQFLLDTEGGRTTYAYDAAGKLASLVNPDGDRTSYSYDAAGHRTLKDLANGTRASYTYDDASRLTLLGNLKSDSSVISSFTYTYDAAGSRTRVVEADGDRVTWTYDATYQLLAEHKNGTDAYAHTFVYDSVGNRLAKEEDGSVTTYTYDVANRLRYSEDSIGDRNTYTYDADGNQRSIEKPTGDITTHVWSYENKLVQIEKPLDEVVTYTYAFVKRDDTEQRVSKDDDTTFTRFVWDEDRIITELDDVGSTEAEYTLEPATYGNLVSQKRDTESSYYHYDALGSTRDLTDNSEVTTDEYSYYSFGKSATTSGATVNPYRFVGEQGYYHDAESGNQMVRQNVLRPEIGLWLSPDQQSRDGHSVYEYAGNNPTNIVDPSGLYSLITAVEQYCRLACPGARPTYGYFCFENCKKAEFSTLLRNFMIWFQLEKADLKNWYKDLPDCPCSLRAERRRRAKAVPSFGPPLYEYYTVLVNDDRDFGQPHKLFEPRYHPGAAYELRSIKPNQSGAGQQCTYDAMGKLIESGLAAGTADRRAPLSIAYWREDITPWNSAVKLCKIDPQQARKKLENCRFMKMYLMVRPIPKGKKDCDAESGTDEATSNPPGC